VAFGWRGWVEVRGRWVKFAAGGMQPVSRMSDNTYSVWWLNWLSGLLLFWGVLELYPVSGLWYTRDWARSNHANCTNGLWRLSPL
jgi:hypothetical protein